MAKRADFGDTELDLVPIMNLVTILIPFLLMASSFVSLAAIDSTLPAIGEPPSEPVDPEEEPLNLSVLITDKGFTVAASGGVLEGEGVEGDDGNVSTIPCAKEGCPTPDTYDTKELTRIMNLVKDSYEDEENVILVPEPNIPYEVIVYAMDATREDRETKVAGKPRLLFPYVVIAGGDAGE